MKNLKIYLAFFVLLALSACSIDEQFDPNGPSEQSILTEADPIELDLIVYGAAARMRNNWDTYCTSTGTIARELYLFDADPRNTEDLLGKEGVSLDNNTFYLTAAYNTRYQTIKDCNLLLAALDNATAETSDAKKQGYRAFANTIKALMYSHTLMRLNDNGIRVDVDDPDNLGPFLSKSDAFTAIINLLDEAYDQLDGAAFNFEIPGFEGFNTPEGFAQFNRAIKARVAVYSEDYQLALRVLPDSHFDLAGDLNNGPQHVFSTASGDFLNPLFKTPGQSGDQIIVHNSYLEDIREGDTRINKFRERVNATSQDGLNGTHETALYASSTAPIDIIRNEELILIYAEAKIQGDALMDAVTAINVIRNAHGLGDYDGEMTKEALTDEMLYHRRYSFWGEGHRMFDLRRYGLLNAEFLPIDREGDQVFQQFPIPLNENQ